APTSGVATGPFPSPMTLIVTGASSGIGAALVSALFADGHRLFVCARRGDRLDEVTRNGKLAQARVCDVSDEAQVEAFIAWVKMMTPHVDALLNCAGGFGAIGPIGVSSSDEWFHTVRVNLFGTYLMIKHALPLLLGAAAPRIVNCSGGGAFSPFPNYSAYSCSKAAVVRLTECLAAELAPQGVAVNAIAPGFVATAAHQATMEAGIDRAGALHYRRTKAILEGGGVSIEHVGECVAALPPAVARVSTVKRRLRPRRAVGLGSAPVFVAVHLWAPPGLGVLPVALAESARALDLAFGLLLFPAGFFGGILQVYNLADRG